MGKLDEAATIHLRSLAKVEKSFGKDHVDVGINLDNLGGLYLAQGRQRSRKSACSRCGDFQKCCGIRIQFVARKVDGGFAA